MQPFIVNKKSWHYRILKSRDFSDRYISLCGESICSYSRMVFTSVLIYALLASGALAVLYGVVESFVALYWLLNGNNPGAVPFIGVLFLVLYVVIACLAVLNYLLRLYTEYQQRKREARRQETDAEPPRPWFITSAWRAFVDKTCVPTKFEE